MLRRHTSLLPAAAAAVVAAAPAGPASAQTRSGGDSAARPTAAAQRSVPSITVRVLRPGHKGANVRKLQRLLNAAGVRVAVDGAYLAATARAVQRFQVAAALTASGVAGPDTIAALRRAAGGPRSVEVSGGLGFGGDARRVRRLGERIPIVAGMSGRDVRQLQSHLRRARVAGAPRPNGEFGPRTRAAWKRFERREDRRVDGVVDAGDIYALYVEAGVDLSPGTDSDPSSGLPAPPLAPGDRARLRSDGLAVAPEAAPEAVKRIIAAGNRIAKKPYKWGGGHGRWEDSGYDCSGSVSYALRGANLLKSAMPSSGFYGYGDAGKGQWVTIYTNAGHMYMVVAGLRFDTSGRGRNGSRWQTAMRDSSAFRVRHPVGL